MKGPFQAGEHNSLPSPSEFSWESGQMSRLGEYSVVRSFSDADGDIHAVGERWVFLGTMFSKFDDLLTICIQKDDGSEWEIPLIWEPSKQEFVIERFVPYFVCLSRAVGQHT